MMIEFKIDNRYRDGNIVKKKGKYVGNKKTMKIEHIQDPTNPYRTILRVGEPLAKIISKEK